MFGGKYEPDHTKTTKRFSELKKESNQADHLGTLHFALFPTAIDLPMMFQDNALQGYGVMLRTNVLTKGNNSANRQEL